MFVTNGSCTEGDHLRRPGPRPQRRRGGAHQRLLGICGRTLPSRTPAFGRPERSSAPDISKTNWESATITTLDDKILPYITNICKRDPRTGKVVTGGIVSCQDSKWLLSWTINRQGQFKEQEPEKVCVWVYGLFTDVPGDFVKKPMKDCTGKEITQEWLYHIGVPVEQIPDLAAHSAVCVPTMMPYITAFFMPRTRGDRPDVIPDGCVNFAFLGQFADTPRDTVFTTEYSVRTAMEAVYGLLGVDRGRARGVGQRVRHPGAAAQHRLPDGRQVPAGGLAARSSGAAEKAPAESNPGHCHRKGPAGSGCAPGRHVTVGFCPSAS